MRFIIHHTLALLILGVMWFLSLFFNPSFPIPILVVFTIVPTVIMLVVFMRRKISQRSRLINEIRELLGSDLELIKIIDDYFSVISEVNVFITLYLFGICLGLNFIIIRRDVPNWFIPFTLLIPILITAFMILRILYVSGKVKNIIEKKRA